MITVWNTPIAASVEQILRDLKLMLFAEGLLRDQNNTGSDVMVTCPFHKGGHYMDGIISKEDYSKRYKELEKTLEDLKDKLLTLEVNEDLQSIEEVIQNIDKEMEEYLQTQSFNESRVEFLNQHLTKVTVNKDYFLLEFDLIGGAILTGKDFYLFVDNPRGNRQIRKGPL